MNDLLALARGAFEHNEIFALADYIGERKPIGILKLTKRWDASSKPDRFLMLMTLIANYSSVARERQAASMVARLAHRERKRIYRPGSVRFNWMVFYRSILGTQAEHAEKIKNALVVLDWPVFVPAECFSVPVRRRKAVSK